MKREKILFSDLTFGSVNTVLEDAEISGEVAIVAAKAGIVLPSPDIKVFKTLFAIADEENLNGCTMPYEEVSKALKTLVGKAVDLEHYRKETVGTWLDARLEGNNIIAYGTLWVENYAEEATELLEDFASGKLTVSFEAWGNIVETGPFSYKLVDIHFCGGALLRHHTQPACPQAFVQEFSKKGTRVLEFAKVMAGTEIDEIEEAIVKEYMADETIIEEEKKITDRAEELNQTDLNDGGNEFMNEAEITKMQEELAELKTKVESLEESKIMTDLEKEELTTKVVEQEAKITELTVSNEELTVAKTEMQVKLDEYAAIEEEARKEEAREVASARREYLEADESVTDEDLLNDDKYAVMKAEKERDIAVEALQKAQKALEIAGVEEKKDTRPDWKIKQDEVAKKW